MSLIVTRSRRTKMIPRMRMPSDRSHISSILKFQLDGGGCRLDLSLISQSCSYDTRKDKLSANGSKEIQMCTGHHRRGVLASVKFIQVDSRYFSRGCTVFWWKKLVPKSFLSASQPQDQIVLISKDHCVASMACF
jgi:hypothetical protein